MAVLTPLRARLLDQRDRQAAPPLEAGRTLVDLFFDRAERSVVIERFRDLVEEMYVS